MLSKYVIPGNKVEIQSAGRVKFADEEEQKKVYQTTVYDIVSEEQLELYMPMASCRCGI